MARNWIQAAHIKKGALHRQLGIPQGQKIPVSTLERSAKSDNPQLVKRVRLAITFRHMQKG